MADFAKGKIQCFCGPAELGAPDDLEKVIIDFISGARKNLDIAVQELDSIPVAQAVLDARWRGVKVRMVLEQDYLASSRVPSPPTKPPEAPVRLDIQWNDNGNRGASLNRRILTALLRNAVDVRADYNPNIFHHKFIVRDYGRAGRRCRTSAVLTGSTNFTRTGTHNNLNHLLILHGRKVCRPYQARFDQGWSGTFGTAGTGPTGAPATVGARPQLPGTINVHGVPVRILFAPDHTPELEVVKQMLKCRRRLDFAVFTFSGSSTIDDAMVILRAA